MRLTAREEEVADTHLLFFDDMKIDLPLRPYGQHPSLRWCFEESRIALLSHNAHVSP